MRDILFLAHRIPYPADRGDKIRSWNLLRHLAGLARVHLACFADNEEDAANLGPLRSALGDRLGRAHVEVRRRGKAAAALRAMAEGKPISLTLFDSPRLRGFVADCLADPEVGTVFAFSGQMGQFVPAATRQRFIMDFGDVDSAKFAQYGDEGSGPMRWINRREGERLLAFERATAQRADLCTFVSEPEAALFRSLTGLGNVRALRNGIDVDFFNPAANVTPALPPGEGPLLLFTGQMDYAPNVEAVRWFARDILPKIPNARFVIAGRNPAAAVRRLAGGRVIVTGAVDDMRSWLAAADVVVAPLKLARGIQNKVLEAMAMGKAVVASPAAFEGIEAEAGSEILVANGAESFAAAVSDMLGDSQRAAQIGAAARRRVCGHYRWEASLAPLAAMVDPEGRRKAA